MVKYTMLGVNGNNCCILKCLVPFESLKNNIDSLESSDFTHDSTNWNGHDEISRTLELKKLKLGNGRMKLKNPISFEGYDSDMGHSYHWNFTINEIYEVIT